MYCVLYNCGQEMASYHRSNMMSLMVLVGVLWVVTSLGEVQGRTHEYTEAKLEVCQREHLNITCGKDEAILMTSARHGIMQASRCFRTDGAKGFLEVIGCYADVLSHLDAMCSGKRACRFKYPDDKIHNTKPCPDIFTAYMEVTYVCVKVESGDQSECRKQGQVKVQGHQGFISSETSLTSGMGSMNCPWLIETHPGQNINITVYHFVNTSWSRGTTSRGYTLTNRYGSNPESQLQNPAISVDVINSCQTVDVAVIYEAGKQKTVTMCSGGTSGRIIERYVSRTNALEFRFEGQRMLRSTGRYLVEYNVAGCPDMDIPSDTWMKRDGETLKVKCNSSTQTWYLTCSENQWVGEVGNCSLRVGYTGFETYHIDGGPLSEPFPYGILFVVAIGVAIGIVFGGGTLALLVIYNKKKRRRKGILGRPGKQYSSMAYHDTNTRAWLHATQQCPPKGSQEQLYIDEGIVRDIQALPPGREAAVLYGDTVMMGSDGERHRESSGMVGIHLAGGGVLSPQQQHPLQQHLQQPPQQQQYVLRGGMGEPRGGTGQQDVQKLVGQEQGKTHVYERPTP